MKQRIMVKIALVFLIGIVLICFFKIYDFASYLVSRSESENEMTEILRNSEAKNLEFKNLDKINTYILKNEPNNALAFLDSLISKDSSRIDLYLKRGFVNYKLKRIQNAKIDFKYVIDQTALKIGGQTVVKKEPEKHYYALIGLMLAENNFDIATLKQYTNKKKESYVSVMFDTTNRTIRFDIDSAIFKLYDWE